MVSRTASGRKGKEQSENKRKMITSNSLDKREKEKKWAGRVRGKEGTVGLEQKLTAKPERADIWNSVTNDKTPVRSMAVNNYRRVCKTNLIRMEKHNKKSPKMSKNEKHTQKNIKISQKSPAKRAVICEHKKKDKRKIKKSTKYTKRLKKS